jgi:uncharacterized repeat protein (TIGR03803 family)
MSRILDISGRTLLGSILTFAFPIALAHAAPQFRVLYSFQGGRDGGASVAGLIDDTLGNLYGTTSRGGRACRGRGGCGVVFKLAPDGSESVLYAFVGGGDGYDPESTLLKGPDGTLYGMTRKGGTGCSRHGCGTVFSLEPDGRKTTLFRFDKHPDGALPVSALVMDKSGDLFGTTPLGGPENYGTAFRLAPDGTYTVLHAFDGGADGGFVYQGLLLDARGNLYGGSVGGGGNGGGDVYEIAAGGAFSVLYTFTGQDGFGVDAPLIRDSQGDLFGTTFKGGTDFNGGTVFEIAADGTESVLYDFTGASDGQFPNSAPTVDDEGNFYGTTLQGGAFNKGTVYRLAPDGTQTVLYSFTGGSDGAYPFNGVIARRGRLYGTTWQGGADLTACGNVGCGTVYEISAIRE